MLVFNSHQPDFFYCNRNKMHTVIFQGQLQSDTVIFPQAKIELFNEKPQNSLQS